MFRDDPACRVFLSTDAGSTGLNLQHASTLVNMDLPWNRRSSNSASHAFIAWVRNGRCGSSIS
ncbi:C-terminal helicase domain-containing protein [Mesorhizobium sp.]|uniref:C-terminal helicase domain-containing protein n=1 Tax=Mesorhizobium sp. TaxID=1871066 RepID=UPI00257DE6FC|nr:C-terminal helicase domain-containing protein [Mesorhizobium sp.]